MGKMEDVEALSIKGQPEIRITHLAAQPCQQGDDFNCSEITGSPIRFPEDILHRIHTLMPLQDAAQVACVSTDFLRSWRSYPNIILSMESLGIKEDKVKKDEKQRDFISRVEHITQNHSGKGVKKFSLNTHPCSNLDHSYVDRWLQIAATPGIEEFKLSMFGNGDIKYEFPYSFLSSEWCHSIQSFSLVDCSFHSAARIGCMRRLRILDLCSVRVTGEELYDFLSNAGALEEIYISRCEDIVCLKIPHTLSHLNSLLVFCSEKLQMIDSNAPKLSTFFYGGPPIHISFGDALHVRKVDFHQDYSPDALYYAITKLPFIIPYVQTLILSTIQEKVNTPASIGRFLHLKYLEIQAQAPSLSCDYDFCSLVSFIDAAPALETFMLRIEVVRLVVDASDYDLLNQPHISEHCYGNLKKVMITGFCSANSVIALTNHIIEKTKSLECLTLDTTRGHDRRFVKSDRCWRMCEVDLVEAEKALVAIQRYVVGRVPPAVDLKVIEPCSKCIW